MLKVMGIAAVVAGGAIAMGAGAQPQSRRAADAITVSAYPIETFELARPERRRFGDLEFIGGLELRGNHKHFGGLSAVRMRPGGEQFLALNDSGHWLTGAVTYRGGKPNGLADVKIAPVMGPNGRSAASVGWWDTESMAEQGGQVFVGVERRHAILRFDMARLGLDAPGTAIPTPPAMRALPGNRGIEALGFVPQGSPFADHLLAISERSSDQGDTTAAFLLRGRVQETLSVRRRNGFDITDLDFLPDGDLVLLERYFSPLRGVAMRLRRVALADIRPGAILDGEIMLDADLGFQIDNMEALSIHRGRSGGTVFTLLSDDNFSIVQRTILLQFAYVPSSDAQGVAGRVQRSVAP